jgi:hypothetical protein
VVCTGNVAAHNVRILSNGLALTTTTNCHQVICPSPVQRGAFDIDATVYPIAIKYNKIFVDAFWNSRKQSFTAHLVRCLKGPSSPPQRSLHTACL